MRVNRRSSNHHPHDSSTRSSTSSSMIPQQRLNRHSSQHQLSMTPSNVSTPVPSSSSTSYGPSLQRHLQGHSIIHPQSRLASQHWAIAEKGQISTNLASRGEKRATTATIRMKHLPSSTLERPITTSSDDDKENNDPHANHNHPISSMSKSSTASPTVPLPQPPPPIGLFGTCQCPSCIARVPLHVPSTTLTTAPMLYSDSVSRRRRRHTITPTPSSSSQYRYMYAPIEVPSNTVMLPTQTSTIRTSATHAPDPNAPPVRFQLTTNIRLVIQFTDLSLPLPASIEFRLCCLSIVCQVQVTMISQAVLDCVRLYQVDLVWQRHRDVISIGLLLNTGMINHSYTHNNHPLNRYLDNKHKYNDQNDSLGICY
jgi:hypothetical protein